MKKLVYLRDTLAVLWGVQVTIMLFYFMVLPHMNIRNIEVPITYRSNFVVNQDGEVYVTNKEIGYLMRYSALGKFEKSIKYEGSRYIAVDVDNNILILDGDLSIYNKELILLERYNLDKDKEFAIVYSGNGKYQIEYNQKNIERPSCMITNRNITEVGEKGFFWDEGWCSSDNKMEKSFIDKTGNVYNYSNIIGIIKTEVNGRTEVKVSSGFLLFISNVTSSGILITLIAGAALFIMSFVISRNKKQ